MRAGLTGRGNGLFPSPGANRLVKCRASTMEELNEAVSIELGTLDDIVRTV